MWAECPGWALEVLGEAWVPGGAVSPVPEFLVTIRGDHATE